MTNPLIPVPVVDPLQLAWWELNDYGNARRLAALAAGLLKWVDDEYWLAFDGRRWSRREGEFEARATAHRVAQHLHDEASALGQLIGDPSHPDHGAIKDKWDGRIDAEMAIDRLAALHRHAVKSGDSGKTDGMLKQAKALPELRARSDAFDADVLAYNVLNGTLRFVEDDAGAWHCRFQEGHEPGDLLTRIADVEYDPDATCPQWLDRLVLLQPDPEIRHALQLCYGQSLTGLTDGEEFYTHQGQGRDGKSKTHEVIASLHGEYYAHCPVKTWLAASIQKSGSEHRSDLVRLEGDIRFIVSEEPPRGSRWDSETLKQWTGGGMITARGSGARTEITFKPRGKINVEVNNLPAMPSDDRGWKERQVIIPWKVNITLLPTGAEPQAKLMARLLPEKPGILNWMIDGCLAWLAARKVPRCAAIKEAMDTAWAGVSPIGEWLAECCDLGDAEAVEPAAALYNDFKEWCERTAVDNVPTATKFGRALNDRQINHGPRQCDGKKTRKGIRLLRSDPLLGAAGAGGGDDSGGAPPPRADGDPGPSPDGWSAEDPLGG